MSYRGVTQFSQKKQLASNSSKIIVQSSFSSKNFDHQILINKQNKEYMFSSPKKQPQNYYKKRMIEVAQMSNYQSIPSILQQSNDFNYTILKKNNQIARKHVRLMEEIPYFKSENQSQKQESVTSMYSQNNRGKCNQISYKGYDYQNRLADNLNKEHRKMAYPKANNYKLQRVSRNYLSASNNNSNQSQFNFQDRFLTIDTRLDTNQRQQSQGIDDSQILQPKIEVKAKKIKVSLKQQEKFYLNNKNLLSRQKNQKSQQQRSSNKIQQSFIANPQSDAYPYQMNAHMVVQESSDQQDEEQFQKDASPGPGYYSINNSTISTKDTKQSFNCFGGKSERFRYPQKQQFERKSPTNNINKQRFSQESKPKHIKYNKKAQIPFGSNIPRQIELCKDILSNPGPVDYYPRVGIEQQLIRKIQRSFKGNFGVSQKRFSTLRKWDQIGPGKYNAHLDSLDSQICNRGSYFFISKKNRFQDKHSLHG